MGRDGDGNLTMPSSIWGDALDPLISLNVYTGDVGLDDGTGAVGLRPRQVEGHPAARSDDGQAASAWTCAPATR